MKHRHAIRRTARVRLVTSRWQALVRLLRSSRSSDTTAAEVDNAMFDAEIDGGHGISWVDVRHLGRF